MHRILLQWNLEARQPQTNKLWLATDIKGNLTCDIIKGSIRGLQEWKITTFSFISQLVLTAGFDKRENYEAGGKWKEYEK